MIRVLGVDGGQSGIRLRHSGSAHVIEVEGVSRLEGDTVAAVANAVANGWRQGSFEPVERVVLGLSTAPSDAAEAERLCAAVAVTTGAADVWLADDAVTSHAGALSLGWGVSLVAGTGVACLALPERGSARILGGHGYLLGDEGGGFWIGRRALVEVLRAGEGRGADVDDVAVLGAAAQRRLGSLDGLATRLHSADRPVHAIASFARDVQDAAGDGDPTAVAILGEAVAELLALARAGLRWAVDAGQGSGASVPLALGGRLLAEETSLRRLLDAGLAQSDLAVAPRSADGSGLDGAIRLGLAGDDHPYDGLVHRWRQGVPA
jgi:N-acetylglucosamine kinase-like BadF-type ATPase